MKMAALLQDENGGERGKNRRDEIERRVHRQGEIFTEIAQRIKRQGEGAIFQQATRSVILQAGGFEAREPLFECPWQHAGNRDGAIAQHDLEGVNGGNKRLPDSRVNRVNVWEREAQHLPGMNAKLREIRRAQKRYNGEDDDVAKQHPHEHENGNRGIAVGIHTDSLKCEELIIYAARVATSYCRMARSAVRMVSRSACAWATSRRSNGSRW